MLCHFLGFAGVANVFTEVREYGANSFYFEESGRSERVVYLFAGHESGNASAHELVVRGMLAQPDLLGGRQQKRPHQAHDYLQRPEKCANKKCRGIGSDTIKSTKVSKRIPRVHHPLADRQSESARRASLNRPCPRLAESRVRDAVRNRVRDLSRIQSNRREKDRCPRPSFPPSMGQGRRQGHSLRRSSRKSRPQRKPER